MGRIFNILKGGCIVVGCTNYFLEILKLRITC